MPTFKADYNNGNIELTDSNRTIASIRINSLLLNNGNNADNADNFEKHQQQVNYLDSVKDGANVWMLQDLEIYPRAAEGGYPTFPDTLKDFEDAIFETRKDYLTHTTWLKVKKGSVLDPGKNYNQCLWESGLGYEVFLADPVHVETIKTFGSFIDPLEKQNAQSVWPKIGSSVELTASFMKLMGFGESSSLVAKTTTNTAFEYTMNIGCGNPCNLRRGACFLKEDGDDQGKNSNIYFAGNNEKKQFLKTNATSKEKIKFIVIKEWGDKVQVLIYLIYYHYIKNTNSVIMTTCDMVVFMLCLNLAIPCIYTGPYKPKGLTLDPNKKYYSVLEYKPSDNPYRDAVIRLQRKITAIAHENNSFIQAVNSLVENPDTPILVNGVEHYFSGDFYKALYHDINYIDNESAEHGNRIIEKYKANNNINLIPELERELKVFERKYLLVPFLKIKKGTTKKLTMLMTKSYTAQQKPCDNSKPAIATTLLFNMGYAGDTERESRKTFLELALKYFQNASGVQRGGALNESQILLFPEDEDNYSLYKYLTNEEIENDSKEYNKPNPDSDVPIFNPEIKPDEEEQNLLIKLHDSFNSTMSDIINNILQDPEYYSLFKDCYDNFKDTIYTLFVYDSYLDGVTSDIFKIEDYERIYIEYKLFEDLNEPSLVKNEVVNEEVVVAKGSQSPSGPSGEYGEFPFSQPEYDLEKAASPLGHSSSEGYFALSPNPYSSSNSSNSSKRTRETSHDQTPLKRIPSYETSYEIKEGVYGGKKRKTRRIIKKRKYKKTRNTKKTKRNKTIKKQRRNKKRKTRK
jgi:hypothetical protein